MKHVEVHGFKTQSFSERIDGTHMSQNVTVVFCLESCRGNVSVSATSIYYCQETQ